jgi:ParB/RepB/Spo0J family partition protein
MLIDLRNIKPSSQPIRSSWDEDKMNELAQSIKEHGVIVPIKVRPDGDLLPCRYHGLQYLSADGVPMNPDAEEPCFRCTDLRARVYQEDEETGEESPKEAVFEVVYGHRRVDAARRAGLAEIECIVEGMEDSDALVQALIENVQREDMSPLDKARAFRQLMDNTGWSAQDIGRKGIASGDLVRVLLPLLDESPEIQKLIGTGGVGRRTYDDLVSYQAVTEVRRTGLNSEAKLAVLQKAASEGLSHDEARRVAEAYRDAKTEDERQAVLKVRGDHPAFERAVQVQAGVDWADALKARSTERKHQENDAEVAQFFDAVRSFNMVVETVMAAVDFGKFSPEGARFAIRRIDSLIAKLQELKEQLNNE